MAEARKLDERLISVIVPCYNVEDYVDHCARSLLSQFADDYEVIFVNDGSTDGTLERLRSYGHDERIRVVNQTNGGLSAARNAGVAAAKGEYVVFVDGDDLVSPYFISSLAMAMGESSSRMVVGELLPLREEDKDSVEWVPPHAGSVDGQASLFDKICRDAITESACAKLLPRWVCDEVPFPQGRYFEDLFTIGHFAERLDEVVMLDGPIYGYVMRPQSIVHATGVSIVRALDYQDALLEFERVVRDKHPECEGALLYRRMLTYARMRPLLRGVSDDVSRANEMMREMVQDVRGSLRSVISSGKMSLASKVRFSLLGICPYVYDRAMDVYEARVKGVGRAVR